MQETFTISTKEHQEFIDITKQVKGIVEKSKVKEGICLVYATHASGAIIVNENYDSNICLDTIDALNKAIPLHDNYRHDKIDNNAAAHIKSAIIGPSETIPVKDSKLILGKWQSIMFCEFDGPREERNIVVQLIGR